MQGSCYPGQGPGSGSSATKLEMRFRGIMSSPSSLGWSRLRSGFMEVYTSLLGDGSPRGIRLRGDQALSHDIVLVERDSGGTPNVRLR